MPVRSMIKRFREEFEAHVEQGSCPLHDTLVAQLALPAAAQPAAAAHGVAVMSATDVATVTLEIDGRELTVPKGTPLVLAAAEAGIEIPVFCYEPRLGPAIGACRMCLVEIEGMPKLQAACTLTAGDGMKVHTRSENAAEGQEAVLEFILLNHPLDCPVCDKGGECPLQDLTYRYGPGNTRFHLNKRTYEKPLAISPLIALDRERCILCYRCTRFSQDVAQDEQLVARERGASSVIATFEDEPYRGRFSGNVIELCPVGALTSTVYRFKARPWEINDIPSVCGMCAVGCNIWGTVREGGVQRVLSRNHPEVDEGWLCDRGPLHARLPRRRRPLPAGTRARRRAGSSRPAPSSSPRRSRAACATTPACTAPTRSRSWPRASRATRRRTPGPSSCAPPAAARSSAPASPAPATGTRSRPTPRASPTSTAPT